MPEEGWDDPKSGGAWGLHRQVSYGSGEYLGHHMLMRCPKCLQLSGLQLHSIEPNGEVNASVLCNCKVEGGECGWHEWVVLDGWDPEWRKNAGEEYCTKI